jgi:hypothetical protein
LLNSVEPKFISSPYARHCEAAVYAAEAISVMAKGIASPQKNKSAARNDDKLRKASY